jgi:hypothetical protein
MKKKGGRREKDASIKPELLISKPVPGRRHLARLLCLYYSKVNVSVLRIKGFTFVRVSSITLREVESLKCLQP